jgi:signal transduction histidine kinase
MQIETLRQVPLFAHLPQEQLQWLSQEGSEIYLNAGTVIAKQGDPADGFYVILDGETEWTRAVQGQDAHAVTLGKGDVFAELIILLEEAYPTTGQAITDVWLYKLTIPKFWEMIRMCPVILRTILKISTQRSQIHEAVTFQQAKLISLGTLSAGLAHELNNPAAAVRRNVKHLEEILQTLPALTLKMHSQPITATQREVLNQLNQQAIATAKTYCQADPLAQSEAEDAVADWLDDHDISNAWKLAPTLVAAGLDGDRLDDIADQFHADNLNDILVWLEATIAGAKLLHEITLSSTRVSELIAAMKDYSYMDQAPLQEVNLHEGIENTLTILHHKLKQGVEVIREYGKIPHICVYGRQLNQVWTNLIDNAIDAIQGKGHIWIRTSVEGEYILVEIADDGVGIQPKIQSRIFDQFFTTKEAGKGTGLGLDIVRRIIVGQHKGDVRFTSQPGDTRFQIRLPIHCL